MTWGIVSVANKKETVSVSFHYLCKETGADTKSASRTPITPAEFKKLSGDLASRPPLDLKNEATKDRLRFKSIVPIERIKVVNDRTVFGVFKSSYWGHSYENTAKGEIPADSVSLRPFHFMLYLSLSGRIYVASQYLGQFGGYTGLERTISEMIGHPDLRAYSFVTHSNVAKNVQAKEVQVTVSRHSTKISGNNAFAQGAVIAFKKQSANDGFEENVAKSLLQHAGKSQSLIKSIVADLINENELLEVSDADIVDCTVIASVDGKRKKIYLMDSGSFATKFPINVPILDNGHPDYDATCNEMSRVLQEQIISKADGI